VRGVEKMSDKIVNTNQSILKGNCAHCGKVTDENNAIYNDGNFACDDCINEYYVTGY
jgi:formylmethanofuran dehydrogenase subunit E